MSVLNCISVRLVSKVGHIGSYVSKKFKKLKLSILAYTPVSITIAQEKE